MQGCRRRFFLDLLAAFPWPLLIRAFLFFTPEVFCIPSDLLPAFFYLDWDSAIPVRGVNSILLYIGGAPQGHWPGTVESSLLLTFGRILVDTPVSLSFRLSPFLVFLISKRHLRPFPRRPVNDDFSTAFLRCPLSRFSNHELDVSSVSWRPPAKAPFPHP